MDGLQWKILEISMKMDDLGVPLFQETPIFRYVWGIPVMSLRPETDKSLLKSRQRRGWQLALAMKQLAGLPHDVAQHGSTWQSIHWVNPRNP